jgi:hypothetical protein
LGAVLRRPRRREGALVCATVRPVRFCSDGRRLLTEGGGVVPAGMSRMRKVFTALLLAVPMAAAFTGPVMRTLVKEGLL